MNDAHLLIDTLIVEASNLADARGVDKCRLIIDIVQKLAVLKEIIPSDTEEENHGQTSDPD